MLFTTILLAATASLAAAQANTVLPTPTASSAPGTSTCQAQQILDTCVSQREPQVLSCPGNDYSCYCQQYGALLTCYDNCPGDPARFGVSQQQLQNCAAASAYGTTTMMVASSTSSASSMTSTSTATSEEEDSEESGTASGSAASATETGAAAALSVEVTGGVLAVVAAGFGLFL